ncbi:MAG: chemotaxis protein CheA [Spirochaetales bacterium]|nr:chemotaxis protein CheA [Spirochaetales bacterium]
MSDYLDPQNEELLKDFFIEAELQVEILEKNILVLEDNPSDSDAVDEIFRAAHTLKGAAGTVQMEELAKFTHLCEDVLDGIRSGAVSVTGDVIDLLLSSIDVIKAILEVRAAGGVYDEDISTLQENLSALLSQDKPKVPPKASIKSDTATPPPSAGGVKLSEYEYLELKEAAGDQAGLYRLTVTFNEDNPMNTVGAIQVYAALKPFGGVLKTEPEFESLYEDMFFPEVIYYLASDEEKEAIADRLHIPDVIVDVKIEDISLEEEEEEYPSEASVAVEKTPSAEEKKAPSVKPEDTMDKEPSEPEKHRDRKPEGKKGGGTGSILRVDSRRIDNLLNLVSETVITKATFNQISNLFAAGLQNLQHKRIQYRESLQSLYEMIPRLLESGNGESRRIKQELEDRLNSVLSVFDSFEGEFKSTVTKFKSTSQSLSRTTGELQEAVMQIRMVPISQIFSRFPRLIRDVSKSLHKNVRLEIHGEDTELDKSVIDDLLDPLIHCVRNSVDHGIENPEERAAAGKNQEGLVVLSASNEGNMIVIQIEDDGKGIDVESIHRKAIDKKLIHPDKRLSDLEAFNLIFEPGFSTAASVTDISGRGVGLDVVRKQIEKLNGSVHVWSEKGKGTKLTIKIPLTLAIIQGLLVKVGEEIYAIPITSVLDSHRIKPEDIRQIDNHEVFNLREDVISLVRLSRLFRLPAQEEVTHHFVVVVGSGDKKMGLMVDSLIGEEDVVIKSLRDKYTNSPGIAGATILGDGTVSLIIDVSQLLELGYRQERAERQKREARIY